MAAELFDITTGEPLRIIDMLGEPLTADSFRRAFDAIAADTRWMQPRVDSPELQAMIEAMGEAEQREKDNAAHLHVVGEADEEED